MNEYESIVEAVGISGVCVVVGRAIKAIPSVPDWVIPFALPAVGAAAACVMDGATGANAIKGFLAGGNAVWMNQAFRQGQKGSDTIFLRKEHGSNDASK